MPPVAPTTPVQPAAQTSFVVTNINAQVEPSIVVTVFYAAADAFGNPILGTQQAVVLGASALAQLGTSKAKFYAALTTQVPALAGVVT